MKSRHINTGCLQGRVGPTAEGCRQATIAAYKRAWPLFVLAAALVFVEVLS